MESVFNEMDHTSPVIYLLSAGADPTDSIEGLARKKRRDVACVSMGEVQQANDLVFNSLQYNFTLSPIIPCKSWLG